MRGHISGSRNLRSNQELVGVRELKTNAARILRRVRDSQASYVLTHRGRAVGVILPLEPSANDGHPIDDSGAGWENFLQAGRRLERHFRRGASGVRLLSSMRR